MCASHMPGILPCVPRMPWFKKGGASVEGREGREKGMENDQDMLHTCTSSPKQTSLFCITNVLV